MRGSPPISFAALRLDLISARGSAAPSGERETGSDSPPSASPFAHPNRPAFAANGAPGAAEAHPGRCRQTGSSV
jgi:hypothetical protein